MSGTFRLPAALATAFAVLACVPKVPAQLRVLERARWQGAEAIAGGGYFDDTRNLLIVSSLNELKEWDGGPTARSRPMSGGTPVQATVCDYPLQRGAGLAWSSTLGTLKYIGGVWVPLVAAGTPPVGTWVLLQSMVFDRARGRAILMVQAAFSVPSFWSFDGTAWSTMPNPPGTLVNGGAAYDEARGGVVWLTDAGCFLWNGASWASIPNIPGPFLADRALAYSSQRRTLLAFGGHDFVNRFDDTWEWDGTAWLPVARQPNWPSPRSGCTMVYDRLRQRCVLFGGDTASGTSDQVWAFDGSHWWDWSSSLNIPDARDEAMLAELPGRGAFLFGGQDGAGTLRADTWLWNGSYWLRIYPTPGPTARANAAMVRAGNDRVLLFGGSVAGYQPLGDTWTFDSSLTWTQIPATGVAPRLNHAMAHDPATNRVYLFGGISGTTWFNDLYWIDVTRPQPTWHLMTPSGGPEARDIHAMCFDERRGRLVLFGGRNAQTYALDDTWEFDPLTQAWQRLQPTQAPSARANASFVYDALRQRCVLAGGYDPAFGFRNDIWEWDGREWTFRSPSTRSIVGAENMAACYDHAACRTVLFGGRSSATQVTNNTYELQEDVGMTVFGESHGADLGVTGLPVVGAAQAPLRVDVRSSSGVSILCLDVGFATTPFFVGTPPLFCSTQPFTVLPTVVVPLSGNPGVLTLSMPPELGGVAISLQALEFSGTCFETTPPWFVRVRRM